MHFWDNKKVCASSNAFCKYGPKHETKMTVRVNAAQEFSNTSNHHLVSLQSSVSESLWDAANAKGNCRSEQLI